MNIEKNPPARLHQCSVAGLYDVEAKNTRVVIKPYKI